MRLRFLLPAALLPLLAAPAPAADGNRLTYLGGNDPYYVHAAFPKLVTPQWVGEEGVEAVVVLAIDDMRGHERWEAYLRPILNRLKRIDGRAPVSIMTCRIDPKHPHLQTWLKEGVSLETHTFDHPCPILQKGDLTRAKATYDKAVDLLAEVPGSHPVAFRVPCCDSLNTPSPRFYSEVFNKTTPAGNFLELDSSVFVLFTPDDPELPRDIFAGGPDRFRKYLPADRSFVNWVENYPYPYVIGGLCWQFPCVVPSDWEAQHLHQPNNPVTVRDWQAALDAVVAKKGVFDLVFHPHGWIKAEQVIDLIDHAEAKHGRKVKFLTFREARDRLVKHLLGGVPLRDPETGKDNGVRLLDLNADGFLDVVIGNGAVRRTRLWVPESQSWVEGDFPVRIGPGTRFGVLTADGHASLIDRNGGKLAAWRFDGRKWVETPEQVNGLKLDGDFLLRDLDGDGVCEAITGGEHGSAVFRLGTGRAWRKLAFALPEGARVAGAESRDAGLRFVDLDEDGHDDVIFSDEKRYGVYLFESMEKGWSRKVLSGKRGDKGELPAIARNGADNGFFVHSRALWWQNEDTGGLLKDHVDRRPFDEMLADVQPGPKSPRQSLKLMQARPGFEVELVAAEPLVQDPVAFAWGPDGKLWVVEMGDYPLGVDDKGTVGGRVRFLEDTDGDGRYDRSTVFLDRLGYPTGVAPWRKGVLVTCAPDIFYAEDTDGDGKADVRKVLFTGFTEGNQQHRVNTLAWGLDNWLYCANGDSGGKVKVVTPLTPIPSPPGGEGGKSPLTPIPSPPGGEGRKISPLSPRGRGDGGEGDGALEIRGRDFRIRPDDGRIELQSGQTQFGRCRDDWGDWFGGNNANPMWHYALDDRYLRRNPHLAPPDPRVHVSVTPGASPVFPVSRTLPRFNDYHMANRFTSACSPVVYRDDLFGPDFAGSVFISEPVHNLVHREVMTPKGVTFTSRRADDEQNREFLASRDNWFRPTTIATGPDGALWVADMYRHVIEHPQWIPKSWQERLDLRAGHDRGRIYRVYPTDRKPRAIPRLDKLDTAGLVAALDSPSGWQRDMAQQMLLWRNDQSAVPLLEKLAGESQRPQARLHALCTLDGLGALTPELLLRALADEHPGVRRHAVRLCEPFLAESRRGEPGGSLGEALLKLAEDPDAKVRMQLAYTLGEWDDPRAGEALGRLAAREAGDRYLFAAAMSSVRASNLPGVMAAALRESATAPAPGMIDGLLRMASSFGKPEAVAELLKAVGTARGGKFEPWQFTALATLLDSLEARKSSLTALAREGGPGMREAVDGLAAMFAAARSAAADPKAPPEERRRAVALLGRGPARQQEDMGQLFDLLAPQVPDELQRAAAAALGRRREPGTAKRLLAGWKGYTPGLRSAVLDALLSWPGGADALLGALEQGDVLPQDIDAARRQVLLRHRTPAVRERAEKVLAESASPDRQKVIEAYRSVLSLSGDAARGKELFAKHCAACHRLGDVGNEVGPDLAALADKSAESLLVAVLDPNRAVEAKFLQYQAETTAGRLLSGMLAAETGASVTLIGADGKPQVIPRQELETLVSTGRSQMPEGLEKDIPPQDLADIFAHLRAAAPPPKRKEFPGNRPELVRAAADGSLSLLPANAEIYGPSIVLEPRYGNLGYWSSPEDFAAWEVEVPADGKYAVWLDWACYNGMRGNRYQLQFPGGRLTGRVEGTGTWDNYKQAKVGEVTLKAGRQRLVFRSDGKIEEGGLIDLRGIRLVPVR